MELEKLKAVLEGEPAFRLTQARQFVYKHLILGWDEALSLPKEIREYLKAQCSLEIDATFFESQDGKTKKALLTMNDRSKVETVLMSHGENHHTVCVSCQVGCSMGCDFCATGKMGLKRNLSVDEIIEQVLVFARILKKKGQRVSNVVFMGMGEPFLNYDNVMGAIAVLNDEDGLNIAARKISVSTCGIITGIERFTDEPLQLNLALSLHAPNNEIRSGFMPVNTRFNIEKTLGAIKKYLQKTGRKVMIEYILLKGINDSPAQAKELAAILKKHLKNLFMVNLIVYNVTTGKYQSPSTRDKMSFKETLEAQGITVTQRYRLGHDIEGACGQLATENL